MKRLHYSSNLVAVLLFVAALAWSVTYWSGCAREENPPTAPGSSQVVQLIGLDDPAVQAVVNVQNRHTPELMNDPNVAGTATGLNDDGRVVMLVFLKGALSKGAKPIPATIESIPVVSEVTGEFRAYANHQVIQTPPVQLGTSGGWRYDIANGYCCSGTLGSLVQANGVQYILSCYHVFWGDIALGGNNRIATVGDPVIQPGLVDVSCNANLAQNVATLAGGPSLPNSNVDCGIAQVISGMVSTNGAILDIGTISKSTVAAALRQAVKKSGRTTGLTRSSVKGLNATVSVSYETECAGTTAFTQTFTGQIIIGNVGSKFLAAGDSGSLMVEDKSTNPRAVGLLFAGSSVSAVANPINPVLTYLGVTMVGN